MCTLIEKELNIDRVFVIGWTALLHAAFRGHLIVARTLVEQLAVKEKAMNDGWKPFMSAAQYGHFEVVEYLLEYDTDVNTTRGNANEAIKQLIRDDDDRIKMPYDLSRFKFPHLILSIVVDYTTLLENEFFNYMHAIGWKKYCSGTTVHDETNTYCCCYTLILCSSSYRFSHFVIFRVIHCCQ